MVVDSDRAGGVDLDGVVAAPMRTVLVVTGTDNAPHWVRVQVCPDLWCEPAPVARKTPQTGSLRNSGRGRCRNADMM